MLMSECCRKHNLKVREHTILGPYVDGLSTLAVSSFEVNDITINEHVYSHRGNIKTVKNKITVKEKKKKERKKK